MAIKESSATALVRFTGLGIILFNKEKQRGEIAIIRDDKHQLSITIQEPRFKDGVESDLIVYEDIASYTDLPKSGVVLEINAKGNSIVEGFEIYKADGEFNRLDSDDVNDFRWIVQMADLHSGKVVKSKSENRYPISKMYIENGFFYAHKLDTELLFEKIEKGSDGNELDRSIFGNVAETLGVKLESDEVVFKITFGEAEESHRLSKKTGLPYRIEIKNMDYSEDAVNSDMPDYYKYLAGEDEINFEFEIVSDSESVGGGVTGKMFCHLIDGGDSDITSIDDLEM